MKNLSLIIILLVGLLYGLQLIECNMSYHKQLDIQLEKRDIINKKKTNLSDILKNKQTIGHEKTKKRIHDLILLKKPNGQFSFL